MLGQSSVQQVTEQTGCKEVTIYSGSTDHYFYRKFYEGALDAGKESGIKINLVEMPKGISSDISPDRQMEIFLRKIKAAKARGWMNCPVFNSGITPEEKIQDALAECGCNPSLYYHSEICKKSCEEFYSAIYARLKDIVANPRDLKKVRLRPYNRMRQSKGFHHK